MYIVIASCTSHIEQAIILGISKSKNGVFEIIWNYVKINIECFRNTFEEDYSYDNINIYKISAKDHNYLNKLYDKHK